MSGGYELHQKLRTKAVRQLKKKDYDGAIASLYDGATQLLQAKEQGSGCDLACYLVDVYSQAHKPSTEESRSKVTSLLQLAAPDFWRKKIIDAAIKWSVAVTETPAGDGYLRLAIADILSKDGEYYLAEAHYVAACTPPPGRASATDLFPPHAPKSFACMMLDWLTAHGREAVTQNGGKGDQNEVEKLLCGAFALRGLLPLLVGRSLTSSKAFIKIYISRLVAKHPSLLMPSKPNPKPYTPPSGSAGTGTNSEVQQLYLTHNSELNFAQMVLAMTSQAVEHKKRSQGAKVPDNLRQSWQDLLQQFGRENEDLTDDFLDDSLPEISKIYFDVQPARGQGGNFMQDMLGSLMGGGGGGSGGEAAKAAPIRRAPPPRLPSISQQPSDAAGAEDLDLD